MTKFKFSVGPWNVHSGADSYGPATRDEIAFEEKIRTFAELGFSAIQFHDDDAVPNINDYTEEEIKEKARTLKKMLDKYGLAAEFVAPRLWMDGRTADGGFMSTSEEDREYAMWRAYRSIDIAKELGCNKIALGHHYDDVIETILMGMLYGAQIQTMMPKLHSTNFEGMELIRPMYLIREDDIKHWRDYNDLHFIQCACRFTDTCTTCREDGSTGSKRMEIKGLIKELKEINPFIEGNIFKSVENVNLSTVIAYKENGVKHHFLENYDTAERTEENG